MYGLHLVLEQHSWHLAALPQQPIILPQLPKQFPQLLRSLLKSVVITTIVDHLLISPKELHQVLGVVFRRAPNSGPPLHPDHSLPLPPSAINFGVPSKQVRRFLSSHQREEEVRDRPRAGERREEE
ncbi:hypothetical protein BHM03_00006357 [Ensete ventricosum]|uniref:Uncharacterized protein n=1 Tax=Ensete ventricosum TaxID=4639 RepID=A0A445MBP8_ENSVE|nr:hypothetical protein BHM03_00006357 [Ensete ventricosum]